MGIRKCVEGPLENINWHSHFKKATWTETQGGYNDCHLSERTELETLWQLDIYNFEDSYLHSARLLSISRASVINGCDHVVLFKNV